VPCQYIALPYPWATCGRFLALPGPPTADAVAEVAGWLRARSPQWSLLVRPADEPAFAGFQRWELTTTFCSYRKAMWPIVFVHGLVGAFADPRAVSLLRPAGVVRPDLLGYGSESGTAPDRITIDAQVRYVRDTLDRTVPGTRVHLVGHSAGGVIAMVFAHRYPDRVAAVVNVEGNFTLADAFWSAQLARKTPAEVRDLLNADRDEPARWLRDGGIEPTEEHIRSATEALAYQPATTLQAMARAVVEFTGRPDYAPLLREVFQRTPVHLVAGARSRPGWDVPEWALAAAASYTEIPDTGHMVMLEAPQAFGELLVELTKNT
jgi:lipase